MRHARHDYDRIQDPAGRIPANEPVFLIRGQDSAGPEAVRAWAQIARLHGASEEIIKRALDHADDMEAYQKVYGRKVPDL